MKKIISIALLGLLVCSALVMAQGQVKFSSENGQNVQEMEQRQNKFQNRYNFTCEGNCTQTRDGSFDKLEVRTQQRFLFWDVESKETYDINENGEIVQASYNIWSRLLNRNRIKA